MKLHSSQGPRCVAPEPHVPSCAEDLRIDRLLMALPRRGDFPKVADGLLSAYRAGELGPHLASWVEHLLVLSSASRDRLHGLAHRRVGSGMHGP
jgi:hypothetical protein